jgi:alpha-L-rhamnosidase
VYCHYSDKKIIEENYDANKRWVEYLKRNSNNYLQCYSPMGDWASPIGGNNIDSIGFGAVSVITPTYLIATGFFYYSCILMAKMAGILGKPEEREYYLDEADKIKTAFNEKYYKADQKYYHMNSQGSNTLPLYLDMIPAEDKKDILKNLITDIVEKNNTHLTTGNLCTRYIIEVLFNNDREDLAFDLLTQTTYPSWGYMIENGATTVWERWEHITEECELSGMASHNHPMYGAVGVCFYKYIAGIQIDETNPGFKNIFFRPNVPPQMMRAQASVETLRGLVGCSWKKDDSDKFEMNVTVPFNCTGEVSVPVKGLDVRKVHITSNGATVFRAAKAVDADGIEFVAQTEKYLVFLVGSGKYTFRRVTD